MESYYIWLFLFSIVAYFIVTDNSVAQSVYYISNLLKFQYGKTKWWLLNNPRNPIVKYFMWRRAMKLAKELEKEFKQKNNVDQTNMF
jgi:hypothetical protein